MTDKPCGKRGIAYVIVLVAVMLLLAFGASLHFITRQKGQQITHSINDTIGYALCESVLGQGLYLIKTDCNDSNSAYADGKPEVNSYFMQLRLPLEADSSKTYNPGGGLGGDKVLKYSDLQQPLVYNTAVFEKYLKPVCDEMGCELKEAELIATIGEQCGIYPKGSSSNSVGNPQTVGIDIKPDYVDPEVQKYFDSGTYPGFQISFPSPDFRAGIEVAGVKIPIYKILNLVGLDKLLTWVDPDKIINTVFGKKVLPYEVRRDGAKLKDISEVLPDEVAISAGSTIDQNTRIERYGTLDLIARVKFALPGGEEVERKILVGKEFKVADIQPISHMYSLFIRNRQDIPLRFNATQGGRFYVMNFHEKLINIPSKSEETPGLIRIHGSNVNRIRLGLGDLTNFFKTTQFPCIMCTPRMGIGDLIPHPLFEAINPGIIADSGCGHWWFPASITQWHKAAIVEPFSFLAYVGVDLVSEFAKRIISGNWPNGMNEWLEFISNVDFYGARNVFPCFGTHANYGWFPFPDLLGRMAKTYLFGPTFMYPTMTRRIEGYVTKEILEMRVAVLLFTAVPIPIWKTKYIDVDKDFTYCSGAIRPKDMQDPDPEWKSKDIIWDGSQPGMAPSNLYTTEQYIKKASCYYDSYQDFADDFEAGNLQDSDGIFLLDGITYINVEDGECVTFPPDGNTLFVQGRGAIVTPGDIKIIASIRHIDRPIPSIFSLISLRGGIMVSNASEAVIEACLYADETIKTNCKCTIMGNLTVDYFDKINIGNDLHLRYKSTNCRASLESIKPDTGKFDPRRYHVSVSDSFTYFRQGGGSSAAK